MKAIIQTKYGLPDVLNYEEVNKPIPGDDQVLVRIHAASVNAADWRIMRGKPLLFRPMFGFPKPKNLIPGSDLAGVVEAVGKDVTRFRIGDEIFGENGFEDGMGAFAEYAAVPARNLLPKPANLSFEEAAAIPLAGGTALRSLRRVGKLQAGQKVLINGASGGVGTYALQIAKALGAEVTAVVSTRNVEQAHELGADHVIDYKKEDFAKSSQRYDLILGVNGSRHLRDYKRCLSDNGTYVMVGGTNKQIFQAVLLGPLNSRGGKTITITPAEPDIEDLIFLKKIIEDGKLKPVIDRAYPLSQTAEAMRYIDTGHARGKVVIKVV